VNAASIVQRCLAVSRLDLLPVRVSRGIAEGARWSLFPWTSYWRGTHEPAVQARLVALWDWTGKSCWDLGSHFGLFAIGLGRRVGPGGAVAAFEPSPGAYRRLQMHVRRNRLPWVKTFCCAVSDHAAVEPFVDYTASDASTTGHLLYDTEPCDSTTPMRLVETVRLDDWVEAGRIAAPDFIKLDVEGHGHRACRGAARTIAEHRPVILAGLHSPQEVAGIRELLDPLGYDIRAIDEGPVAAATMTGRDFVFTPRA
jgi:FkbM family methyltransferase